VSAAAEAAAEQEHLPPTLGPQVVQWLEEKLVHGPGPVRGRPYRLTLEQKAILYRAYEVYPQGHELEGRRQHQDVVVSRGKGLRKTELGGGVGAAELGPDGEAPVRCDGFNAAGEPVGSPVGDPDIPFLATTQTQAKDLAFERAKVMMGEGPLSDLVDLGAEEIYNTRRDGKLYVVTARAKSKDGYLPTHTNVDEPHLYTTPELHELVRVVYEGFPKTLPFDPWGFKTSTAYAPGERSVLEGDFELWRAIQRGELEMPGFLLDHLEASSPPGFWGRLTKCGPMEDDVEAQLRAMILEASGLAGDSRNVEAIVRRFKDPRNSLPKLRRYWLNQIVKDHNAWLNPLDWDACLAPGRVLRRREPITLGFDGSQTNDATALIGCTADGHLFVIKIWERPEGPAGRNWQVDADDVDRTVRWAMRFYDVALGYFDRPFWSDYVATWHADFGDNRVAVFQTKDYEKMAAAVEAAETAVLARQVTHDGNEVLKRHVENARRQPIGTQARQAHERPPCVLRKEHDKSPLKVDGAVAAVLAKQAHAHAVERRLFRRRGSGAIRFR
jgi:phage terminase large subunit-like protein